MRTPFLKSVRSAFLGGVIVLAPLAVTVWVFLWLIETLGGPYKERLLFFIPDAYLERPELSLLWSLVTTVIVLVLITLLGFLSRYVATRFLFGQAERLLGRVPLFNGVYSTVKQIVATFSAERRAVFQKVVLVQFPRPGCYAIGFLTNNSGGEVQKIAGREMWNIFVPTTPNPTSGFLIMLPREEFTELEMTIGDGMKLIISGGAVTPEWPRAVTATNATMVAPSVTEKSTATTDGR